MAEVRARAPAKVILFGEHAVNRGHAAIAASVGLYAHCRLRPRAAGYRFEGDGRVAECTREELCALAHQVDAWRTAERHDRIRSLVASDFFAPAKYVLASALGDRLPEGMEVGFWSGIPQAAGFGSSAACFAALARALGAWLGTDDLRTLGQWAYRGDLLAHGGVASALDTQTSLLGGVIRYRVDVWGSPLSVPFDLRLVVGDTGVPAQTGTVNAQVRAWEAVEPAAAHYFRTIGLLAGEAEAALTAGEWERMGLLMTLNQLALARIGVSTPELETLCVAALRAGALGAKLSGSGGGGIMIALVHQESSERVARAIADAGGRVYTPEVAVPGAHLLEEEP
jgi:mevalonate kinase